MKTRLLDQSKTVDAQFKQTLKDLNKAEFAAWGLFIGVEHLFVHNCLNLRSHFLHNEGLPTPKSSWRLQIFIFVG